MFWASDGEHSYEIFDEDELSKAVFNTIHWYRGRNSDLSIRNKELHDNAKDTVRHEYEAAITRLNNKLELSYGQFASQKEKDRYEDFERRHMHERATLKIQSGKKPYLIPTGCGIGTILEVVCPICGEKEDITDNEVW